MKIAVITAIYDDYDNLKLKPDQRGMDIEWICVTDTIKYVNDSRGWKIIYEPREGVHPNLAAKQAKMQPWKYTNAHASIWLDASFRILSPTFVEEAMQFANPLAQFKHPWVNCCLDEADVCIPLPKYDGPSIEKQKAYYISEKMPRKWGLWAGNCIARMHTSEIKDLGNEWMRQEGMWFPSNGAASNDQISEPFVLYKLDLRPNEFPGGNYDNTWITFEGSSRHSNYKRDQICGPE